jgi:HK97 family phage major capsid protein
MANQIVEEFTKMTETVLEERAQNEKRLEAVEKAHETVVAEQDVKLADLGEQIHESTQIIKGLQAEKEMDQARIEMLEALAERPSRSAEEKSREIYSETFFKALREKFGNPHVNTELDTLQKKDVTIGTNLAGGFALPKEIGASVDALLLKLSDVVANVKNIRVGTSDYQELVSIHGGTSGWVSETGSRTATGTPNLRSQKPTWGELYAYPQVSEWSIQDLQFNVADWLTSDVAEGMAEALSTVIWNGDGSNKPTGMTNGAPVATDDHASPLRSAVVYEYIPVASSPQALGADDIIDLTYQLNPRYRANSKFAMNTVTQGFVRKLKDSNGQYLWQPSLQLGQPDRLLGYEIFTWEDMANPTTADGFPVAFGDFQKGYILTSRTELMIQQESITNPGYVRFYVRRRYGGFPLNNDSIKLVKLADT